MKSKIGKTIVRNFSILFGAHAVTWVTSFVLLMFLPRYLGSEDYGRLYLALSIKMILGLLIDFGGSYLIPKQVARSQEQGARVLSSYIILRIFLWILSVGVLLLIGHILGYSEHVNILLMVMAITMFWEGGSKAYKAYFQGIERMEYPSVGMVSEKVFVAIFAVIALLFGADSIGVAIIMTVGALFNLVVLVWYSRNFVKPSYQFNTKVFSLLQSGMPYFLFSLFSVIYYRVDAVMLSYLTTETVTGWYGGAWRFFDMVMMLPMIYKTVVFPVFSKLWDNEDGMLQTTISKSLKLILIFGVPVGFMIFLFAEDLIHFFMGLEEYGPAVIVLQIFSVSIPIIFVDIILGSAILGAANRQRGWAIVGFLAIFLNVGINYLLIPHTQALYANGGIGAAIATFITEAFMLCAALYLLPANYLRTFKLSYITKPLLSGMAMALVIWLLSNTGMYWMINAVIGAAVYIAGLFAVKLFDADELKIIKNLTSFSELKVMLSNKNI